MPSPRIIIAALLLAAPLVSAPRDLAQQAPAAIKAASAQSGEKPRQPHEPFQITITFKRYHEGKITTDKTYTLLATTGERLPAIRDDARFRASATDAKETLDSNTDVDILDFKRLAESVFLALRISVQGFTDATREDLPKLPVAHTHQYLVSPTVPLGKTVIVYSAMDTMNDIKSEVQLLVQPIDLK